MARSSTLGSSPPTIAVLPAAQSPSSEPEVDELDPSSPHDSPIPEITHGRRSLSFSPPPIPTPPGLRTPAQPAKTPTVKHYASVPDDALFSPDEIILPIGLDFALGDEQVRILLAQARASSCSPCERDACICDQSNGPGLACRRCLQSGYADLAILPPNDPLRQSRNIDIHAIRRAQSRGILVDHLLVVKWPAGLRTDLYAPSRLEAVPFVRSGPFLLLDEQRPTVDRAVVNSLTANGAVVSRRSVRRQRFLVAPSSRPSTSRTNVAVPAVGPSTSAAPSPGHHAVPGSDESSLCSALDRLSGALDRLAQAQEHTADAQQATALSSARIETMEYFNRIIVTTITQATRDHQATFMVSTEPVTVDSTSELE
ncbi:hypothetical protein L226DRAFT_575059 [Lentinus tigrinus ALCF2SS1-7]|uniref:Uncharacterized protein n=1 Tax=Lentinus tigrinus ALCF2SS1-6 TaxID=1328759 RepID=A0A5C2RWW5_9APHY|nr:hypothetical protein L227DRAFT_615538 [Lentinus tigrinus ALCF2SS1-6]RPD70157.1 hypothetical protein L226DRAFT_575059 [Lentinus tigrinus ALCF2SS1-7]